jgi:hypothetical protein
MLHTLGYHHHTSFSLLYILHPTTYHPPYINLVITGVRYNSFPCIYLQKKNLVSILFNKDTNRNLDIIPMHISKTPSKRYHLYICGMTSATSHTWHRYAAMIHYPIYHPTHPPMPHRIILHLPYTSFLRIFFHNPSYTSSTPCIILSTHHPYIIHPPSLCHSPSHPIIPSSICSSDLVRHVKLDNYSYYVVDQEYIMHT